MDPKTRKQIENMPMPQLVKSNSPLGEEYTRITWNAACEATRRQILEWNYD